MRWQVNIPNFLGGFAPAWYKSDYSSYGNKNQAATMTNIDLTNPGYMTQGPGLSNLTNGTQAGAVTTLMKGIQDYVVASDTTYGIGGNLLYKITSTTVIDDATWPHTIDKAAQTAEDGEDVCAYKGALYYTYNHSNSLGDIGKFDLNATFDDDWGSTVPSGMGTLTGGVPHQMIVAGNDNLYIANGRYVTSFDGTTLILQALDLPQDSVIVSIAWMSDRLWIAANRPNLSGSNKNTASIYIWDGTTTSWESEVKTMGTIGGMHVKNGVLFVYYQDISSIGGYKLGYVSGITIQDVANYTGALPAYYQITDYKDFLLWNSNGSLFAWGSGDRDMPIRLFQIADGGYGTVGSVVCPFGTPLIASTDGSTNFRLASFSNYDTNCSWKSLVFDITADGKNPTIDLVRINFETLASGSRVDWTLRDNNGIAIHTDTISFAKLGAANSFYCPLNGKVTNNFRVEFDFSNGSTTAPVKIKNCHFYGKTN